MAFAVSAFLKLFLFDFIIADGISMEPSIRDGSLLVVNRLQYGFRVPGRSEYLIRWSVPQVGDIVIFYTPSGNIAVKRSKGPTENGKFVVRGDNSLRSFDSRSYGPIPADNIIGRVIGIR